MEDEVLYDRLFPKALESRIKSAPIAYLPLGTLEWHGPHLPLGSDHLQSQGFFIELAKKIGGVVLPPLYLGPDIRKDVDGEDYYGMDILQKASPNPTRLSGSAYWVPDKLFSEIIEAIFKQIQRAGFKIIVAHGHGPSTNYIIDNKEELELKHIVKIFTLWRNRGERDPETEFQYDHAASNETSIMMTLHPSLVHMEQLPTSLQDEPLGIIGKDPRTHASKEHGKKIVEIHLKRMVSILKLELEKLSTLVLSRTSQKE
jgi:creatinine amidohydrolase